MINPLTGEYSIVTNYDPKKEAASGYKIDPTRLQEILDATKNGTI